MIISSHAPAETQRCCNNTGTQAKCPGWVWHFYSRHWRANMCFEKLFQLLPIGDEKCLRKAKPKYNHKCRMPACENSHTSVKVLCSETEKHGVLWALQIREDYGSRTVMLEHYVLMHSGHNKPWAGFYVGVVKEVQDFLTIPSPPKDFANMVPV